MHADERRDDKPQPTTAFLPPTEPDTHSLFADAAAPTQEYRPASFLQAGRMLGIYRLIKSLGRGGMGETWEAEETPTGRLVALKVMLPAIAAQSNARQHFLSEARAAAWLRSDHVVTIFYVGDEGDTPFLVMELLSGEPLSRRLERLRSLPASEVARVGSEVAQGLATVHAAGLVHGDVTPSNIWLESIADRAKLLDFGLARVVDRTSGLTAGGTVQGTPGYMAPEQITVSRVDARADLFSLGCVLYKAATGRPAFEAERTDDRLRATQQHDPPPARAVNPAVPAALSDLIARLMAKRPADRPSRATWVAEQLRRVAADPSAVLPPVPPPVRWGRVVGAVAALATAALVLTVYPRHTRPDPVGMPAPVAPVEASQFHTPLRVTALDVRLFALRPDGLAADAGVIGRGPLGATLGDQVTVRASLSRPAYSYILACRADDVVELCYPADENTPPTLADRPSYPDESDRSVRYELSDGVGVWAFAVLASDEPLPSWREWLAGRQVPWKSGRVPPGEVWIDDGVWLEAIGPGGLSRGDRGKGKVVPGQSDVVTVTDWLKEHGAMSAVGFVVQPKGRRGGGP